MSHLPGSTTRTAILHGAGYVGRELIQLVAGHPELDLAAVTSRTFAGQPLHVAHASLRGTVDLDFTAPDALDVSTVDALLVAAEHGQSMHVIPDLLADGFDGPIVDLSADFRFRDADVYPEWFGTEHAAPELLDDAVYGLPEVTGPYPADVQLVANPGCFATGLTLALAPLAAQGEAITAHVTALTGASGSGARPSSTTHFPDRDGNVRAYKVLAHQHVPEVNQTVGDDVQIEFVPASGPWTRGIWGTVQVAWPVPLDAETVAAWFDTAYSDTRCVRVHDDALPEMQPTVGSPFGDVGWQVQGQTLVVGFALDNLMKGAASQAVQNLNLLLGLPDAAGLLPQGVAVV